MGIDIIFWAEGDLSSGWYAPNHETGEDGITRAFGDTTQRWFDEDYPRGDWCIIYSELCELKAQFPRATIRLGHDHMDNVHREAFIVTRQYIDRMFRAYEKENGIEWENGSDGRP